MNIIDMAKQAGLYVGTNLSGVMLVGAAKSNGLLIHMTADDLGRFAVLVRAAALEEAITIIEDHRIPVGNSAAGEMACEWTYDALHRIRDDIRALKEKT